MTDGAPDPGFSPDDKSVEVRFVRSSGPGGQNVNKVSTAVELRFTPALDDKLTARAMHRPEVRIATKPGPAARRRRLTEKRVRAATKVGRSAVRGDSD